ncbi:MAG: hypothetical protein M1828_005763 [Chrysothrix sp. TS-e1954]|nr:MAG: hypothetical protein M1828_005763 [Chrysothrix sp. TS-e1954]
MLSRRLLNVRPAPRVLTNALYSVRPLPNSASLPHSRQASSIPSADPEVTDPGMNGGYVNPPRIKRQFRDPHADWWDPVEKRNFGEPVHEDNDILAVFSPEEYTHMPAGKAALHFLTFVGAVGLLAALVNRFYPDTPAVPKGYPGGLDVELGGERTMHALKYGEEEQALERK